MLAFLDEILNFPASAFVFLSSTNLGYMTIKVLSCSYYCLFTLRLLSPSPAFYYQAVHHRLLSFFKRLCISHQTVFFSLKHPGNSCDLGSIILQTQSDSESYKNILLGYS